MLNYDFHNLLSAFEFECFCRDLINEHEGLDLANFAEGRDGGIDLRYSQGKGKSVIVQAKRYKNYSDLKTKLKEEVAKVKKLKPKRYMITTTVDLSPANKDEIVAMFAPYIHNERDIWGMQDLNKYLAQHPAIEQKYYKLWLASTSVINNLINKNVVNWTAFEREEIEATVRTYVMNDSFNEALAKLIEHRYVVISGEPGIGKTTLARVLVMKLLTDKFADATKAPCYEEFYYTNSDIDNLVKVMQRGKRQVFFFDDFLGKVALELGGKNFDSRLVQFIKACQREPDKLFILATREYILQQGLAHYSVFRDGEGIELSKCMVDMGKYTRFVRAQILYNHLVANEIPQPYINAILEHQNYLKIIDHSHFSPRIIETFITNGTHNHCKPEEYFCKIEGFFDHPDSVWLDAFGRLSAIEQEALLVLATMGTPVMYDLWKEAYDYFFNHVHREANYLNDADWNKAVKVLQNNFIKVNRDREEMYVDFHNPGVFDVLTRYFNTNGSMRHLLLENAYFIEQAFGALREDGRNSSHTALTPKLIDQFYQVFERLWDECRSCRTSSYSAYGEHHYSKNPLSKAEVLLRLQKDSELMGARPSYVEQKMTQQVMDDNKADFYSQMELLGNADLSKTNLDLDALFETYPLRLFIADECLDFVESVENVFPGHAEYLVSDEFCAIAAECLKHDLENTQDSDLDELVMKAEKLCESVPELENEPVFSDIKDKAKEYSDYLDAQADAYQDDPDYWRNDYVDTEAMQIDNLFATIKE